MDHNKKKKGTHQEHAGMASLLKEYREGKLAGNYSEETMGEDTLKQKLLAVKLLQSEGKLSIASTGKDPCTGRLVIYEYRVRGPIKAFLSTTTIDSDEEVLNRCIVLFTID